MAARALGLVGFGACLGQGGTRRMRRMARSYWLVKQEPEAYSWDDFVKEGETYWDGVRNYQARNNLRAMKKGDLGSNQG
jgi:hypothetical protein